MLDYKELMESKERGTTGRRPLARVHGYKRTDPEYYINQIPIAQAEHIKYSLIRDERLARLSKKVALILIVLSTICWIRLKGDSSVVRGYKTETYEQSTEKAQRFLDLQTALSPIISGGKHTLKNTTSPQYKALEWLANDDPMQMALPSDEDENHQQSNYQLAQRYILAVLYFATGGPNHWKKKFNWLSKQHVCDWKDDGGVRKCDSKRQVMDISLLNNLHGTIPEELTKIQSLRVIYLSRNNLTGTIPSAFGDMPHLNYLGLQRNKLTGTVPTELGKLSSLSYLGLEKNDLTGSIDLSHPLCKLRSVDTDGNPTKATSLLVFTTDCRGIEGMKPPEIECQCCTECFRY